MIGAIHILNFKGDSILYKPLRKEIPYSVINYFKANVVHLTGQASATYPVLQYDRYHFLHTQIVDGVYLIAVTSFNVNCALVFEFLSHFVKLLYSYLVTIDELRLRKKIPLITELLEEIIDNGYPQITDAVSLKSFIQSKEFKNVNVINNVTAMTNQITGQITWRKPGITYKRNEIYLDVVEKVNLLMNAQGTVLSSSVDGALVIKAMLSGMPECKCGINDKFLVEANPAKGGAHHPEPAAVVNESSGHGPKVSIALDDCTFHQCVRLNKYEANKSITFIPPDGKFELLRYRTSHDVSLPYRVISMVKDVSSTRKEYKLALKSNYKATFVGTNIEIVLPITENAYNVNVMVSKGKAKYNKGSNYISWKLKRMHGNKEAVLSASVNLIPSNQVVGGSRTGQQQQQPASPVNNNNNNHNSKTGSPVNINGHNSAVETDIYRFDGGTNTKQQLKAAGYFNPGQPNNNNSSNLKKEIKPPISMKFEVPFSCCGMKVKYLKVYEPKLNYSDQDVMKWVRYMSTHGDYEFRFA